MTEPIRVLQVVASLNAGGMENYIMNLYRMVDKSKVQFDFVVHHAAVGVSAFLLSALLVWAGNKNKRIRWLWQ